MRRRKNVECGARSEPASCIPLSETRHLRMEEATRQPALVAPAAPRRDRRFEFGSCIAKRPALGPSVFHSARGPAENG